MDANTEYLNEIQNRIERININPVGKKFYQTLLNYFEYLNTIDIDELSKKLPTTRKSTSKTAIQHLGVAFKGYSLNLVLGAGISAIYGIPNWSELLQRLLIRTIEQEPKKASILAKIFTKIFNPSPVIAGRFLQDSLIEEKSDTKFENEVRKALYEKFEPETNSSIMDEIIKFCVAPGNTPNLNGIITYNYDDIIESKIRDKEIDVPFQSVYGQSINPDNKSLPIYHVHGFLPRSGSISKENAITLGEFVYHEQYNNLYSWNNIVQINKFREKTCLFIGISLTDPNIRRLLDIANSQRSSRKFHYILRKRTDYSWVSKTLDKILQENPEILSEKVKADLKTEETVNFLIELKNRFEEKDSESLGVKTVWINDYEKDISDILSKIRN